MVDSDDEYVQEDDYEDENDFNLEDGDGGAGASSSRANGRSYGTRAKGQGKASRQATRAKERWEGTINKDFGSLREGTDGMVTESLEGMIEARKRKRLRQDTQPFQRGIIRHVILILDLGESMLEKDMRPNRFIVMLRYVQDYIREFFEQNPISQMSIMAMYDGICIRISELGGNPADHINAVLAIRNPRGKDAAKEPKGTPSLQNALELSRAALYHTPSHGTREVIILLGALLTLDPGDIGNTIKACIRDHIRVSIIGMSARLKVCHEIVSRTNAGDDAGYTVALDQQHLHDLLMATTTPPVIRTAASTSSTSTPSNPASLLMMGFPSRIVEDIPTLCACHGNLTRGGYTCSRCQAKICSLPATCPSCHLTLILSTHLARSYHHLFPLRNWVEVSWARAKEKRTTQCKGCLSSFPPIPSGIIASSKRASKAPDRGSAGTTTNGAPAAVLEADLEGRGGIDGAVAQELAEQVPLKKKVEGASESSRYECESCGNHFCIDCDLFCHEVVHNCPGCLSNIFAAAAAQDGMENGEGMDLS